HTSPGVHSLERAQGLPYPAGASVGISNWHPPETQRSPARQSRSAAHSGAQSPAKQRCPAGQSEFKRQLPPSAPPLPFPPMPPAPPPLVQRLPTHAEPDAQSRSATHSKPQN